MNIESKETALNFVTPAQLDGYVKEKMSQVEVVRASSLRDVDECPRRFMFKHRWHLVRKSVVLQSKLGAASIGDLYHVVMEYRGVKDWEAMYWQYVEKQKADMEAHASDSDKLIGKLDAALVTYESNAIKALMMGKAYLAISNLARSKVLTQIGKELELNGVVPGTMRIPLAGRVDSVYIMKRAGETVVYIVDWKTLEARKEYDTIDVLGTVYPYGYAMPIYSYLVAMWLEDQGIVADKMFYTLGCCLRPRIKMCKTDLPTKKDVEAGVTQRDKYYARCLEWFQNQGKQPGDVAKEISWPVPVKPEKYTELLITRLYGLLHYFTEVDTGLFRRVPSSCVDAYGRICPYKDLCYERDSQQCYVVTEKYNEFHWLREPVETESEASDGDN